MEGLRADCVAAGGEEILGLEIQIDEIADGLLEFHAYGTAVKRMAAVHHPVRCAAGRESKARGEKAPSPKAPAARRNASQALPPQAMSVSRTAFSDRDGFRQVGMQGDDKRMGRPGGEMGRAAEAQAEFGWTLLSTALKLLSRIFLASSGTVRRGR